MWFTDLVRQKTVPFLAVPCHEFELNYCLCLKTKDKKICLNVNSWHTATNSHPIPLKYKCTILKLQTSCTKRNINLCSLQVAVEVEKVNLLRMPHMLPFSAERCWCGAHNDWGARLFEPWNGFKTAGILQNSAQIKRRGKQAASFLLCPWESVKITVAVAHAE